MLAKAPLIKEVWRLQCYIATNKVPCFHEDPVWGYHNKHKKRRNKDWSWGCKDHKNQRVSRDQGQDCSTGIYGDGQSDWGLVLPILSVQLASRTQEITWWSKTM